jgi:hypothetical protein
VTEEASPGLPVLKTFRVRLGDPAAIGRCGRRPLAKAVTV